MHRTSSFLRIDAIGVRQRQHRIAHGAGPEWPILVEHRKQKNRCDERHEEEKEHRDQTRRQPPVAATTAYSGMDQYQQQGAKHQRDQRALGVFTQPGAEAEVRQSVLMLAEPIAVDA